MASANDAVNKAAGPGQPVTQEIAVSVKGDNGRVLDQRHGGRRATPRPTLVAAGKLKSTDGVYGIRFAHNTEGIVTGLTMTKQ